MIRVGTCSWADDSFVKAYYPAGVDRLSYYAERFDVVEANSTYYRLPDEALVARWADKLPDGFVMHVKAFGLMTRHPVKVDALPDDLRAEVPVDDRARVDRPPADVREEVFRRFRAALEPLREAGKLGGILTDGALRGPEAELLRLSGLGARPARQPHDARRVSPQVLV